MSTAKLQHDATPDGAGRRSRRTAPRTVARRIGGLGIVVVTGSLLAFQAVSAAGSAGAATVVPAASDSSCTPGSSGNVMGPGPQFAPDKPPAGWLDAPAGTTNGVIVASAATSARIQTENCNVGGHSAGLVLAGLDHSITGTGWPGSLAFVSQGDGVWAISDRTGNWCVGATTDGDLPGQVRVSTGGVQPCGLFRLYGSSDHQVGILSLATAAWVRVDLATTGPRHGQLVADRTSDTPSASDLFEFWYLGKAPSW